MKSKITEKDAGIVLFAFAAGYLVFQIILSVLGFLYGPEIIENNFESIILINEYILILGPVLLYAAIKRPDIRTAFRLNKLKIKPALVILLMAVPVYFAASAVNGIIIYLLQNIGEVPAQQIPVPVTIYDYLRGLFIVALTPAVCEELLHRGVMLSAYENRGSMRAVVITAILFGIFHFDVSNLLGPILIGIVIGIYVIRTNSIFAGVLAHFLNNAIAESILYATRNDTELFGSATEKIGAAEAAMLVVFVAVGIAVVRILLKLFRKVTDDTAAEIPPSGKATADAASVVRQWPLLSVAGMFLFMAAIYIMALRSGIFGV